MGSKPSPCRQLHFEEFKEQKKDFDIVNEGNIHDIEETSGLNSVKDLNKIHSSIPNKTIPHIGMEFETEDQAWQYYLAYGKLVRFVVRKSKSHNDKYGKLIARTFCCSAEGKRGKDKRDGSVKVPRPETRCGCLARMKVNSRQTGKFRVIEFVVEHNHYLSRPNKTHLYRSHRSITSNLAVDIEMAHNVGIALKVAHELMARKAGGRENVGFIPEDYKNYLRSKRTRDVKIGDTGGVLEYLQKMQFEDPNFFYAIQVDEDDLITNIFWSDGKMKANYANFGDVIYFDTTYRKNKEGRPIALFVGVNHHKQTTIFGAALLYDETSMTFEWLFDTFTRAMSGKKPMTILTDQDAAMAKALASKWSDTHHRLCIWHIYQNAAIHLSSAFTEFKSFAHDFSTCIYDFEEEEDFVAEWNRMLEKYDLQNNDWLKRLFGIKEKWALVYGRQYFCADMTTTQRSESMNSVLKRYVNYKHNFLESFNHFQRLLEDRRYEELKADFRANISFLALQYPCELLKHAANMYTPKAFKCFQTEWCKSLDAKFHDCGEVESVRNCRNFQFTGIFCSHILKVFMMRNIVKIPSEYILKRWTRKGKTGFFGDEDSTVDTNNLDPKLVSSMRYRELCRIYVQLATRAAETEETYKIAKDSLLKMLEEVDAKLQGEVASQKSNETTNRMSQSGKAVGEGSGNKIKGIKAKAKTTSGKRLRSSLEKVSNKRKSTNKSRGGAKVTTSGPPLSSTQADSSQSMNVENFKKDAQHSISMTRLLEEQQARSVESLVKNNLGEHNNVISFASVSDGRVTETTVVGVRCNNYSGSQIPRQGGNNVQDL
ncbi:protein FAR1-RELATED SEQUENCE 5-like [Coffea arabica]|uniref:Protein FAR1-RELATED SEQUENCE n=1 Tax=Coffea arabica TaxID=13443 RepID=A0A6P6SAD7_COFAR